MHKLYLFLSWLIPFFKDGKGFDLKNKTQIDTFNQKKEKEISKPKIEANPAVKSPDHTVPVCAENTQEKLSQIIRKMNEINGTDGVKDILEKDTDLKESTLHNSREDFTAAYYDHLDNALAQGSTDTKKFFYLLLKNQDLKKEIMGIFIDELYKKFREDEE